MAHSASSAGLDNTVEDVGVPLAQLVSQSGHIAKFIIRPLGVSRAGR